jgi:hypothetical protein
MPDSGLNALAPTSARVLSTIATCAACEKFVLPYSAFSPHGKVLPPPQQLALVRYLNVHARHVLSVAAENVLSTPSVKRLRFQIVRLDPRAEYRINK